MILICFCACHMEAHRANGAGAQAAFVMEGKDWGQQRPGT